MSLKKITHGWWIGRNNRNVKIETRPYLCVSALGRPCPHWQRWGGRACASLAPLASVALISWEDPSSSISPSKETLHLVVPPPAFPTSHLQMEISEKLLGFMRTQKDGENFTTWQSITAFLGWRGVVSYKYSNRQKKPSRSNACAPLENQSGTRGTIRRPWGSICCIRGY